MAGLLRASVMTKIEEIMANMPSKLNPKNPYKITWNNEIESAKDRSWEEGYKARIEEESVWCIYLLPIEYTITTAGDTNKYRMWY